MATSTKSLMDTIAARPQVDNRDTFNALWSNLGELFDQVAARFELQPDASTADLQPYHAIDGSGAGGHLSTFAGPEIDWLVFSWVGNPKASFSNMHLTVSLSSKIDAPHLGLAFGTAPHLFFYMDFIARMDLAANPDYMDAYYQELNEEHLRLHENPAFTAFVSRNLYMRVTQTAASLCFTAEDNEANRETLRDTAQRNGGAMARQRGQGERRAGGAAPGAGGAGRVHSPLHRRARPDERAREAHVRRGTHGQTREGALGRRPRAAAAGVKGTVRAVYRAATVPRRQAPYDNVTLKLHYPARYGDSFNERDTGFVPPDDSRAPFPVVIFMPGINISPESYGWVARRLASAGFLTVTYSWVTVEIADRASLSPGVDIDSLRPENYGRAPSCPPLPAILDDLAGRSPARPPGRALGSRPGRPRRPFGGRQHGFAECQPPLVSRPARRVRLRGAHRRQRRPRLGRRQFHAADGRPALADDGRQPRRRHRRQRPSLRHPKRRKGQRRHRAHVRHGPFRASAAIAIC